MYTELEWLGQRGSRNVENKQNKIQTTRRMELVSTLAHLRKTLGIVNVQNRDDKSVSRGPLLTGLYPIANNSHCVNHYVPYENESNNLVFRITFR